MDALNDFFTKLRTCPEVDRFFRMANGTCLAAAKAGLIKTSVRAWRGRDSYLVDPQEAYRMWGPK